MLAKGGRKFVTAALLLLLLFAFVVEDIRVGSRIASTTGFCVLVVFFTFFFRDPEREPVSEGFLAPADGYVAGVYRSVGRTTIFIEMHVTNVHVQRAPLEGRVTKVERVKGKHHKVYFLKKRLSGESKAVRKNSRAIIEIQGNNPNHLGETPVVRITQISGILARRCKPYVRVGDQIARGDRVGIILFGSLVKLDVEGANFEPSVKVGDKVKAGVSVIGRGSW